MVMQIIESDKRYNLRVLGAIEICIPWTFLAFQFTILVIINVDIFLQLIAITEFTSEATIFNTFIFMLI